MKSRRVHTVHSLMLSKLGAGADNAPLRCGFLGLRRLREPGRSRQEQRTRSQDQVKGWRGLLAATAGALGGCELLSARGSACKPTLLRVPLPAGCPPCAPTLCAQAAFSEAELALQTKVHLHHAAWRSPVLRREGPAVLKLLLGWVCMCTVAPLSGS